MGDDDQSADKRKRNGWIAGGVGAFLVVGAVTSMLDSSKDEPSPSRAVQTPEQSQSTALPGSPIPPSPGEAYKIGGFGNTYLEGIYEAPGGGSCRWIVQRDLAGDESSIIRRGFGQAGQRPRVALRNGEYFTSTGCGTWERVARL